MPVTQSPVSFTIPSLSLQLMRKELLSCRGNQFSPLFPLLPDHENVSKKRNSRVKL